MNAPIIKTNILDLSPAERLRRYRKALAEGDDSVETLREYLDPNAPVRLGVTIADRDGAERVSWQHSMTAPSRPGDPTRIRDHVVRVREDPWAHLRRAPRKRSPLEKVESMTRRYVTEWRRGNTALLDGLLREICGEYWKAGSPITEDALRMLAAKSLADAENRLNRGKPRLAR